jgi:hypothetical protein
MYSCSQKGEKYISIYTNKLVKHTTAVLLPQISWKDKWCSNNNPTVKNRKTSFFMWRRVPQQVLRTHRSLEAYCANLWWRWSVFFFVFPCNGAPVEWNWQAKTEVLGEKTVPVPFCPPEIPHGQTRDRKRASAVRDWQLTAWAMARPKTHLTENKHFLLKKIRQTILTK